MTVKDDLEDICLWPDGTWCYAEFLEEMLRTGWSDDFERLPFDSPEWKAIRRLGLISQEQIDLA